MFVPSVSFCRPAIGRLSGSDRPVCSRNLAQLLSPSDRRSSPPHLMNLQGLASLEKKNINIEDLGALEPENGGYLVIKATDISDQSKNILFLNYFLVGDPTNPTV